MSGDLAAFLADRYREEDYWANVDGGNQRRQRDLALKRAILAEHCPTEPHPSGSDIPRCTACLTQRGGWQEDWHADPWPCATVRQLGTEFAEHELYKESWKP